MAKELEIYKCAMCRNVVWILHGGKGELTCCGRPMKLYEERALAARRNMHVPIIEKTASGFKVQVGTIAHPMDDEHYIEWIELIADGKAYRQFLDPGDVPEAVFNIEAQQITAREYCSLHKLWEA